MYTTADRGSQPLTAVRQSSKPNKYRYFQRLTKTRNPKTFRWATELAHFADLSPHTYSTVAQRDSVLNVGWLCSSEPYETGVTSEAFHDALAELVARPVILHRGAHMCNLANCTDRTTGNGQIRVLGNDGIWYSAPTLVHHYVTHHDYMPPDAFISAVLHGPDSRPTWFWLPLCANAVVPIHVHWWFFSVGQSRSG